MMLLIGQFNRYLSIFLFTNFSLIIVINNYFLSKFYPTPMLNLFRPTSSIKQKVKEEIAATENIWQKFVDEQYCGGIELSQVQRQKIAYKFHHNLVSIVYNRRKFPYFASGMLISPNLVLTCAHGMHSGRGNRHPLDLFEVFPSFCENSEEGYKIQKSYIPSQYEQQPRSHDYALLKLTQSVKNSDDFIPLKADFRNDHEHLAIFGFPASRYRSSGRSIDVSGLSPWGVSLKNPYVEILPQGSILYTISTEPGQSGSPIIEIDQSSNEFSIIAVHDSAYKKTVSQHEYKKLNMGTLLSAEKIDNLQRWAQSEGATMFLVAHQREESAAQDLDQIDQTLNQLENYKIEQTTEPTEVPDWQGKNKMYKSQPEQDVYPGQKVYSSQLWQQCVNSSQDIVNVFKMLQGLNWVIREFNFIQNSKHPRPRFEEHHPKIGYPIQILEAMKLCSSYFIAMMDSSINRQNDQDS